MRSLLGVLVILVIFGISVWLDVVVPTARNRAREPEEGETMLDWTPEELHQVRSMSPEEVRELVSRRIQDRARQLEYRISASYSSRLAPAADLKSEEKVRVNMAQSLDDRVAIQLKSVSEEIDAKLAEYEKAETAEDKALRLAYEAIQRGDKVTDIVAAVVESLGSFGTTKQSMVPSLAFAPATATEVTLVAHYRRADTRPIIGHRRDRKVHLKAGTWTYPLPEDAIAWGEVALDRGGRDIDLRDLEWTVPVPHIPIEVRNKYDVSDPSRVVLFEVDQWAVTKDTVTLAPAPRPSLAARIDPVLLRHLTGSLYVVESVWDMSDLEAKLLAGIRRS